MEPNVGKPSFLRNILVRLFLFCVFVIALRFAYVVTIRGESCDVGDFCFFALPENLNVVTGVAQLTDSSSSAVISSSGKAAPSTPKKIPDLWATAGFQKSVQFYSSVFQDLMSEAVLSPNFKTLCVDTATGADVFALRELGVEESIGISKKGFKPLVIQGQGFKQPFSRENFDFVFCGGGVVEKSAKLGDFVAEIERTLKPEGFLVVHTGANDTYSFESLLGLFNFCKLVKSRDIDGLNSKMPFIREIVLQKIGGEGSMQENSSTGSVKKCSVPSYKRDLIKKAEPLIVEEPKKPWITLKKNAQKIKYLPSMVDISFKPRYVYVDVGARSYGSSIVSWFKKQYPKQNKTFEIYAIEADKTFHNDYKIKKGVTLLPYAAWVRNESLFFEINEDPGHKEVAKGRGMGRIQPVQTAGGSTSSGDVDQIQGFDFADWLKHTVTERDYVVMKMDVEGTEFDLIPRLFKTGAICLIDELFLECHYNRWQKCCPGERSAKYEKTYGQCLNLFTSLRESGVLVHQWW
ncbi:methyltransferase [Perilla frutescens var. hirtella]|uniref:Methyltransferase n=1 Tax=Perilla frutescens var. hirtella TaxID=608512 RepID=A0AAD4IQJ0_PERFH|nr:methyltransferase [Perilla frutescens var. hirtella]KAH6787016.1 methyltransferase [Perilla frutescens var. hirtella]